MSDTLTVQATDAGKRLDAYLAEQYPDMTRNMAQNLIADGRVTCAGRALKKNYKLLGQEVLQIDQPAPQAVSLQPEDLPLDIVYEDGDIIVVNKARGMVVHPAAGNWSGTLVHALLYHCGDRLSGINGEIRPGIVHRIDKDTSGLLVVAKNDAAHHALAEQIARHAVRREYEAVLSGVLRADTGVISQPIARHRTDRKKMSVDPAGKPAITHYQVIARYPGYTHAAFSLETGRTHQIRVHTAYIGHPIVGDPVYGPKKDRFAYLNGQCLHAAHLTFDHPRTGQTLRFDAPLPEYFVEVLQKLQRLTQ